VCEVCLGQNPYVKMVKLPMGAKLCKISNLAYQAFRWKAGPQGRYKETIISYAVAKEKNICQTCLNDMQYGLPVGVRDKILRKSAAAGHHQIVAAPESDIGSRYHYQNLGNDIDNVEYSAVGNMSDAVAGVGAARELDEFARARASLEARNKTAFRNLPKLCSFWLGGGCGRVARKTCPFRPCCGVFVFPELAGSKASQELMQPLVRDLEANGPAAVMKTLEAATRTALQDAQKGKIFSSPTTVTAVCPSVCLSAPPFLLSVAPHALYLAVLYVLFL
jgi:pre-mRNA-splicing factor RBM22/SLT11